MATLNKLWKHHGKPACSGGICFLNRFFRSAAQKKTTRFFSLFVFHQKRLNCYWAAAVRRTNKRKRAAGQMKSCSPTHFSLDHVDASGAEGLDTVVDVHHSFTLGHIQHDIQHDVAAGPARPHAGCREEERQKISTLQRAHWHHPKKAPQAAHSIMIVKLSPEPRIIDGRRSAETDAEQRGYYVPPSKRPFLKGAEIWDGSSGLKAPVNVTCGCKHWDQVECGGVFESLAAHFRQRLGFFSARTPASAARRHSHCSDSLGWFPLQCETK